MCDGGGDTRFWQRAFAESRQKAGRLRCLQSPGSLCTLPRYIRKHATLVAAIGAGMPFRAAVARLLRADVLSLEPGRVGISVHHLVGIHPEQPLVGALPQAGATGAQVVPQRMEGH